MKLNLHKSLLIFTLFFWGNGILFCQEKKIQKAQNQYDRYQYIDAQNTYLKVIKKGYKDADLLKSLANSYYFNSQFDEALPWYKELLESYASEAEPEYYFRYAQTLKASEQYEEASKYMQKFTELTANDDQRAKLLVEEPDYLERIDFQSGRFEIKNTSVSSYTTDFGAAFLGKSIVFASSRDTLIFNKNVHQWNNESFLDLFEASYADNGELSNVKKLGNTLNTKFHESTPVYTKDGQAIYFTRNNFDERKLGRDQKGTTRLKIYRSYKNAQGGWTTPQSLPFNSDEYSVAHPALSPDEKTLYFSSDMPGGKGMSDLYQVAINSDGSFGEPISLGDRINTEGKETFPFISTENELYFSSDGHAGLGGLDVFVTHLDPKDKEESLVVNIGKPVNGPKDDFAFVINDTSKRGYFSSNRDGGKGGDDIYSFLETEDLKSFCEITIAGIVTDKDTNELLPGTKVSILDSDNNVVQSFVVGEDASYTQLVKCETQYFVRAEKEEYTTEEVLVTTLSETQTMDTPLALEKKIKSADIGDDLAKILALKRIYFDFDASYIRSDAAIELAKVIEVMKEYPQMKIEVRSHTDSHGSEKYNLYLSDKRAKATVKYMIGKDIAADRLVGKGYGETEPLNDCGDGSNCTKEEYQLNRRSEFIIIK